MSEKYKRVESRGPKELPKLDYITAIDILKALQSGYSKAWISTNILNLNRVNGAKYVDAVTNAYKS